MGGGSFRGRGLRALRRCRDDDLGDGDRGWDRGGLGGDLEDIWGVLEGMDI